ncbi:MAG: carboxypeptidase regulatory-like domain-containing protein [Coriobacteriales bacterium]|jgi:uncharacterized repeat protein (TIGR02543 family)|nr:carboxypeptidase regulatory-like domain-containing protein [Coriobacteriales bacterium]
MLEKDDRLLPEGKTKPGWPEVDPWSIQFSLVDRHRRLKPRHRHASSAAPGWRLWGLAVLCSLLSFFLAAALLLVGSAGFPKLAWATPSTANIGGFTISSTVPDLTGYVRTITGNLLEIEKAGTYNIQTDSATVGPGADGILGTSEDTLINGSYFDATGFPASSGSDHAIRIDPGLTVTLNVVGDICCAPQHAEATAANLAGSAPGIAINNTEFSGITGTTTLNLNLASGVTCTCIGGSDVATDASSGNVATAPGLQVEDYDNQAVASLNISGTGTLDARGGSASASGSGKVYGGAGIGTRGAVAASDCKDPDDASTYRSPDMGNLAVAGGATVIAQGGAGAPGVGSGASIGKSGGATGASGGGLIQASDSATLAAFGQGGGAGIGFGSGSADFKSLPGLQMTGGSVIAVGSADANSKYGAGIGGSVSTTASDTTVALSYKVSGGSLYTAGARSGIYASVLSSPSIQGASVTSDGSTHASPVYLPSSLANSGTVSVPGAGPGGAAYTAPLCDLTQTTLAGLTIPAPTSDPLAAVLWLPSGATPIVYGNIELSAKSNLKGGAQVQDSQIYTYASAGSSGDNIIYDSEIAFAKPPMPLPCVYNSADPVAQPLVSAPTFTNHTNITVVMHWAVTTLDWGTAAPSTSVQAGGPVIAAWTSGAIPEQTNVGSYRVWYYASATGCADTPKAFVDVTIVDGTNSRHCAGFIISSPDVTVTKGSEVGVLAGNILNIAESGTYNIQTDPDMVAVGPDGILGTSDDVLSSSYKDHFVDSVSGMEDVSLTAATSAIDHGIRIDPDAHTVTLNVIGDIYCAPSTAQAPGISVGTNQPQTNDVLNLVIPSGISCTCAPAYSGSSSADAGGEPGILTVYYHSDNYHQYHTTLNISGGGSLTATGQSDTTDGGGAGIGTQGGYRDHEDCGIISIADTRVTATGGSGALGGAGIGSGGSSVKSDDTGAIAISGSAQVSATGGSGAAGIGTGAGCHNSSTTSGSGSGWLSGNVSISNSAQVSATGGSGAAGLGTGASSGVNASKGTRDAGDLNDYINANSGDFLGTLTVSDNAQLTATGGSQAAAVGTGAASVAASGDLSGSVIVQDFATLIAQGATDQGTGIGSGYGGNGWNLHPNGSGDVFAQHESTIINNNLKPYIAPGPGQLSLSGHCQVIAMGGGGDSAGAGVGVGSGPSPEQTGAVGKITVGGGCLFAEAGRNRRGDGAAAAIGSGPVSNASTVSGAMASLDITGGSVLAIGNMDRKGKYAPAIGSSLNQNGQGGTIGSSLVATDSTDNVTGSTVTMTGGSLYTYGASSVGRSDGKVDTSTTGSPSIQGTVTNGSDTLYPVYLPQNPFGTSGSLSVPLSGGSTYAAPLSDLTSVYCDGKYVASTKSGSISAVLWLPGGVPTARYQGIAISGYPTTAQALVAQGNLAYSTSLTSNIVTDGVEPSLSVVDFANKPDDLPDLTYNAAFQTLVSAPTFTVPADGTGVTMHYAVTTDAVKYAPAEGAAASDSLLVPWQTDLPTRKDAGTYKVWYYGSATGYTASTPACVEVTIAKKPLTLSWPTAFSKIWDGTNTISLSGQASGVNATAISGGADTTHAATLTTATSAADVPGEICNSDSTKVTLSSSEWVTTGTGTGADPALTYKFASASVTSAGTVYATSPKGGFTLTGDASANYVVDTTGASTTSGSGTAAVYRYTVLSASSNATITAPAIVIDPGTPTGSSNLVYNAAAQDLLSAAPSVTTPASGTGVTMHYALTNDSTTGLATDGTLSGVGAAFASGWSGWTATSSIPQETAAGTYKVWYYATATNYAASTPACVEVTIAPKPLTLTWPTAFTKAYDGTTAISTSGQASGVSATSITGTAGLSTASDNSTAGEICSSDSGKVALSSSEWVTSGTSGLTYSFAAADTTTAGSVYATSPEGGFTLTGDDSANYVVDTTGASTTSGSGTAAVYRYTVFSASSNATITAPAIDWTVTPESLTYSGQAQDLATASFTTPAAGYSTLSGHYAVTTTTFGTVAPTAAMTPEQTPGVLTGWSTTMPTETNAGSYRLWYYASADNYASTTTAYKDVTIKQAKVTLTWDGDNADDGDSSDHATDFSYGYIGSAISPTVSATGLTVNGKTEILGQVSLKWNTGTGYAYQAVAPSTVSAQGHDWSAQACALSDGPQTGLGADQVAGLAANYTLADVSNVSHAFTITKANPTLPATLPKALSGLVYNTDYQTLFSAGRGQTGGTLYYAVIDAASPAPKFSDSDTWYSDPTDSALERSDAGSYYLWYYVKGDANHSDSDVNGTPIECSIAPAAATVSQAPSASANLVYDASAKQLFAAGSASGGSLCYAVTNAASPAPKSSDSDTWYSDPTDSALERSDAGSYYLWYYVKADANYSDSGVCITPVVCSIAPKSLTPLWSGDTDDTPWNYTYNGQAQGPTATLDSGIAGQTLTLGYTYTNVDGTAAYSSATAPTEAGTYCATLTIADGTGAKVSDFTLTSDSQIFTIATAPSSSAPSSPAPSSPSSPSNPTPSSPSSPSNPTPSTSADTSQLGDSLLGVQRALYGQDLSAVVTTADSTFLAAAANYPTGLWQNFEAAYNQALAAYNNTPDGFGGYLGSTQAKVDAANTNLSAVLATMAQSHQVLAQTPQTVTTYGQSLTLVVSGWAKSLAKTVTVAGKTLTLNANAGRYDLKDSAGVVVGWVLLDPTGLNLSQSAAPDGLASAVDLQQSMGPLQTASPVSAAPVLAQVATPVRGVELYLSDAFVNGLANGQSQLTLTFNDFTSATYQIPLKVARANTAVSGQVLGKKTKKALSAATVTLYHLQGSTKAKVASVKTSVTGGYAFSGLASGSYSLKISHSGYKSYSSKAFTFSQSQLRRAPVKLSPKSYRVKLSANRGKLATKYKKYVKPGKKVTYDQKYGKLPTPSRAHYKFKGWYTKKSHGHKVTKKSAVHITKTSKLYAHWKKVKH